MRLHVVAALLAAVVFPTSAFAGTATGTITVSATVANSCTLSPQNLALGSYNPTSGSALTGSTTVSVTCTKGTAPVLSFSSANGSGQTLNMVNGSEKLSYGLYSDSSYSTTVIGTNMTLSASTGTAQTVTLYARVPASQNVSTGSYSDTVTVTASF